MTDVDRTFIASWFVIVLCNINEITYIGIKLLFMVIGSIAWIVINHLTNRGYVKKR